MGQGGRLGDGSMFSPYSWNSASQEDFAEGVVFCFSLSLVIHPPFLLAYLNLLSKV